MKQTIALLCALILVLSLFAGCSQQGNVPASSATATQTAPAETGAQTTAPAETETLPAETEPAPAETQTLPTETEPAPAETETIPVETEPASVETEPLPPETEPRPAVTRQEPAVSPDAVVEQAPMLFRVTGADGQDMFLFGTIHVGDERIPQVLEQLLPVVDVCDALAVEFDIVAYEEDAEAQAESYRQFLYTDGTTIEDHMPAELYERASALLQEAGLMPAMMRMFNLAMWSQLVEQAALMTKTSMDFEIGMDRELINHCYEQEIEVRDVESPELQEGLMASFPDEVNLLSIEATLDHLEDYNDQISRLYVAWLHGNEDEVQAVMDEEDEDADYTEEQLALLEDYNYKMLDERNLGMRDRAVEWLEAGDRVFFAVGCAHLVGEAGLVNLLRQAGYTVERFAYADGPIDDSPLPPVPETPVGPEPVNPGNPDEPNGELTGVFYIYSLNGQTMRDTLLEQAASQGMSEEDFEAALASMGSSLDDMVNMVREQITLTLNADGTCELNSAGTKMNGTWTAEGSTVTLKLGWETIEADYEDGMISMTSAGQEMVFSR